MFNDSPTNVEYPIRTPHKTFHSKEEITNKKHHLEFRMCVGDHPNLKAFGTHRLHPSESSDPLQPNSRMRPTIEQKGHIK